MRNILRKLAKIIGIVFCLFLALLVFLYALLGKAGLVPLLLNTFLVVSLFLRKRKAFKILLVVSIILAFVYLTYPFNISVRRGGKLGVKVLPIVYGLPDKTLFDRAKRGEVALGGCVITGFDP